MNSRALRLLLASILAIIALTGAFEVYLSVSLGHMMRDLLRGLGVRVGNPEFARDNWFFVVISAMSVLGMIGILLRRTWGRFVSLVVLSACFVWAIAMTVIPESKLEDWFSFRIDRLPAMGISAFFLVAIAWVGLTRSGREIQQVRIET